jgi:threonine/homoserine/homoserine lactone efflux protein
MMPDAATLALFAAAALALLVVPGPSVLYIVARSVEGGRTVGLVSMLGVQAGALVHILFAAVGLSAILASSATAFSVVKWAGAAYLVYLGLRLILSRDEDEAGADAPASTGGQRLSRAFAQGVVVNVFNPKTALFFLAFLPQFVNPSSGAAWAQILVLGLVFVTLAVCSDGLYALLSGTAAGWLRRKNEGAGFRRGQRLFSGGVYVALGLATAVSGGGRD